MRSATDFVCLLTYGTVEQTRQVRSEIQLRMLELDLDLRQAVDDDIQMLVDQAIHARQFADMADLTSAGYSVPIALHFVERLTSGRKPQATRHFDHGAQT